MFHNLQSGFPITLIALSAGFFTQQSVGGALEGETGRRSRAGREGCKPSPTMIFPIQGWAYEWNPCSWSRTEGNDLNGTARLPCLGSGILTLNTISHLRSTYSYAGNSSSTVSCPIPQRRKVKFVDAKLLPQAPSHSPLGKQQRWCWA